MLQILILIAALISYGSLYPFGFEAREIGSADILTFLGNFNTRTTPGNIVANIVLFVPFGFVAPLAVRGSPARGRALLVITVLGAVLAVALQIVQLWLPGRVPAIGDAALNIPGILLGLGLGILFDHGRSAGTHPALRTVMLAPMTLALLWVAYRWFPLVPTIDLQNVKNAVKPLLLQPEIHPVRVLHDLVAWMTFFRLLAFTPARRIAPLWLAIGAILILIAQPLFVGNTVSPNNVAGLALALACMPILGKHYASACIVAGILVTLLLTGLQPFELAVAPNTFHWVPFAGFLGGSMATNSLNLLHKCFFYGAAVFLLRDCGSRTFASAVTIAVWLAIIEALQIWIVSRTAEITDPLLALILAWTISRLDSESAAHHQPGDRRPHRTSPRIRTVQTGSLK